MNSRCIMAQGFFLYIAIVDLWKCEEVILLFSGA